MMTIINCRECKKEVSNQAQTCPHCGIERPEIAEPSKWLVRFVNFTKWSMLAFACFIAVLWLVPSPEPNEAPNKQEQVETPEQLSAKLAECRKNDECWLDEHRFDAQFVCKKSAESRARVDIQWLDDMNLFNPTEYTPFHYKSAVLDDGTIILWGNALKAKNEYGAWERMEYSCEYNKEKDFFKMSFKGEIETA